MNYDAYEQSQHDGKPVECYEFTSGAQTYRYTSADAPVTLPAGTFAQETISRSEREHSEEDGGGGLEVTVPRTNAVAALFTSYTPEQELELTVYRAHRGDEASAIVFFSGTVSAARMQGSEVVFTCISVMQSLDRNVPTLGYQIQCNWSLFDLGCGIARADWKVMATVEAIDGADVVAAAFEVWMAGHFNGGYLERANGERRFIIAHSADRVTLMSPFANLAISEVIDAYPGCDGLEATCAMKYGAGGSDPAWRTRHLGFARVPLKNPYDTRLP